MEEVRVLLAIDMVEEMVEKSTYPLLDRATDDIFELLNKELEYKPTDMSIVVKSGEKAGRCKCGNLSLEHHGYCIKCGQSLNWKFIKDSTIIVNHNIY